MKKILDPRNSTSAVDGCAAVSNRALPKGFTLIELLVVITIIAILAALVLNTAGFVQKKAARSRAETEIAALSAALESYKADNGDYPVGAAGSPNSTAAVTADNSFLRAALSPSSGKVYFEFSKNMGTNLTTNGLITDPFGENYGYYYQTNGTNTAGLKNGAGFFDLWSRSASTNTNIWTKNW